jgi:hypothetical protein
MEDESGTEMDSNHPLSSHHQTHHQHHLDVTLNDSKKRTNNHNSVFHKRFFSFQLFKINFSLIRLVIIIHLYRW